MYISLLQFAFFLTYIDIVFCFIVRFRFDLDTFLTRAFYYSNHIVLSIRAITFFTLLVKSKGVFIATQLNSTQLNSTDPVEQRTAKSVVFLFMTSWPTN